MRILTTALLTTTLLVLTGCSQAAAPSPTGGPSTPTVTGTVHAGPVCPVERPGDSSCAPRPVGAATIVIEKASGGEVARVTSAADGSFSVHLAAGDYRLVPQPVEGLMGTAPPLTLTVGATGVTTPATIDIQYDTGIR